MKNFATILLLMAMLLPATGAELTPAVLKRAKSRIESLLGNRHGAATAPVDPANPFILPQNGPVASAVPTPTNTVPQTKSDALTRLAASLNVSGYVQIQGVPHLIINGRAYQENDLIPVREASGSVAFVRLKQITESDFILELDDVELQQKHTVK